MNTNTPANDAPDALAPLSQRLVTLLFLRWLFSARILGRILCFVLTAATLVVLFYVEEKVRGYYAWKRYEKSLLSQGISLDIKTIQQPPVPAEKNFARTPFLLPLYTYTSTQKNTDTNAYGQFEARLDSAENLAKTNGLDFRKFGYSWRKAELPDLLTIVKPPKKTNDTPNPALVSNEQIATQMMEVFLQTTGPVLDELFKEAATRPQCSFDVNVDVDDPFAILLPQLAKFKWLAQQCIMRATAELCLKQSEAAMNDLELAFRVSDALQHEPLLISFMVTLAIRDNTLNTFWHGLATHQWNPAQLARWQARFEASDILAEARLALMAEQILCGRGIEGFARLFPQQITFDRIGAVSDDSIFTSVNDNLPNWLYPKGWFYFERINYHRIYNQFIMPVLAANRNRLDKNTETQAAADLDKVLQTSSWQRLLQHKMFACMLIPAIGKIYDKAARHKVTLTLAATACALERCRLDQGQYPKTLAELTPKYLAKTPMDSMNGQPLNYALSTDGQFVLYSVGENGVDDGGLIVLNKVGEVNSRQGDWVWKYPVVK